MYAIVISMKSLWIDQDPVVTEHHDIVIAVTCQISDDDFAGLGFPTVAAREHLRLEDLEATCMEQLA